MRKMSVKDALPEVLKRIAAMSKAEKLKEIEAAHDAGVAPILRELRGFLDAHVSLLEYPILELQTPIDM